MKPVPNCSLLLLLVSPRPVSCASISVGLWDPVCDAHLSLFSGRGERGALHEENVLQAAAAVLHSPGHWHALLQRPVSAHPRGSVDAAVNHLSMRLLQVTSVHAGLLCSSWRGKLLV